jgi:hypothetical protein
MAIRDMQGATELFLEAVPTFGAYELMNYEDLIFYTVFTAVYGPLKNYRYNRIKIKNYFSIGSSRTQGKGCELQ